MRLALSIMALAMFATSGIAAAQPQPGQTLPEACASLPVTDACALIAEAARMLEPSYARNKAVEGVAAFNALGYDATYFAARAGAFAVTTDLFLVSRRGSNRLFVVITGTESPRDWYENAKFGSYAPAYLDGQFYVPPGHAGFRRGMLNVVNDGVVAINEFDQGELNCAAPAARPSGLARHLCQYQVASGVGPIETVIVGHSRGAGIGILLATVFAGLEIQRSAPNGPATVARQAHWPLVLHAVIGFAPPYAIYHRVDPNAPAGFPDQWTVLRDHGILARTIWFINERDIVPSLSLGDGRHFGHRFRIRGTGEVRYDGDVWGPDTSLLGAHSSVGYCADTLAALEQSGRCREVRQNSEAPGR
jgi:hypothetical protein